MNRLRRRSQIKEDLKNDYDIKNEDDLENEDDINTKDNLKNEDDLKNEDNLIFKTVPGQSLHNVSCACSYYFELSYLLYDFHSRSHILKKERVF